MTPRLGTDGSRIVSLKRVMRKPAPEGLRLATYICALAAASIALSAYLVATGRWESSPIAVIALGLATALAERWTVPISATTELSVYLLPTVLAAVVLDPLAAGLVAAASMLGPEILRFPSADRAPFLKWMTYTSSSFITGAMAGLAADTTFGLVSGTAGAIIAASIVAMAVAEALDFGFTGLTAHFRGRRSLQVARALAPVALTSFLIFTPAVTALALAYEMISPWTLPLFLLPGLAFHRLYTLYQRERRLTDELRTANETLARANLSFAAALIATLDARDRYTAGHSAAVAIYSRDIAARMGLPEDDQAKIYLCGLVHDIGKIGLPAGLLEKPGALTLDERRLMQEHSAIGERILANVEQYEDIARIVRHHHERIDGEGYPDRLQGDEIPLLSRIIAVADAYNAMTSDRPYRDAMPSRVARLRLAQAVESQFDTTAVAAFEAVLASTDEDYRLARRSDFRFFRQDDAHETDAVPVAAAVGAA